MPQVLYLAPSKTSLNPLIRVTLFGSYVVNRFAVALEDSASLQELTPLYLGEEIDGQYLWVYQEVAGLRCKAHRTRR